MQSLRPFSLPSTSFAAPECKPTEPAPRGTFANLFLGFVENVNTACTPNHDLECGKLKNTHTMQIASAKSDVQLHLITQLAQKISSATTTLMQMQI